jgi:non-structural maintenance of chromosomes element 1
MIHEINNQIEAFSFEIHSTHPQTAKYRSDTDRVYALVNTVSDQFTQLATVHSPDEIAYIKRVLDAMFEKHNTQSREVMAVSSMDAVKLHRPPRDRNSAVSINGDSTQSTSGITMKAAEEVLSSLLREGWFERSRSGSYTLSPRGLMELRGWLRETYNDDEAEESEWQPIKDCNACKEIITIGLRCASQECNVRLHDFCARQMFQNAAVKTCPVCKTEWTGKDFVGERAARGYQNPSTGTRVSIAGTASNGRRRERNEEELSESMSD